MFPCIHLETKGYLLPFFNLAVAEDWGKTNNLFKQSTFLQQTSTTIGPYLACSASAWKLKGSLVRGSFGHSPSSSKAPTKICCKIHVICPQIKPSGTCKYKVHRISHKVK